MGTSNATIAVNTPMIKVPRVGMPVLGFKFPKSWKNNPSRDMRKKTRGWPNSAVNVLIVVASRAPNAMIFDAHDQPGWKSNANDNGYALAVYVTPSHVVKK